MKANKVYTTNNQPCTKISISFTIDSHHIIDTILYMLYIDEVRKNLKINRGTIEDELRKMLWADGHGFNAYMEERVGEDEHEKHLPKATELAKKYYPDFF